MAKRKKPKKQQAIKVPTNCGFCKSKNLPSYKEYKELGSFLSDRAKIVGKDRSGVCSKHQRLVSREIKRARHLGLLPFSPGL